MLTSPEQASKLQDDLELLHKWECKWDMHFNPSKCQIIQFTACKIPIDTAYYLHNSKLESDISVSRFLRICPGMLMLISLKGQVKP